VTRRQPARPVRPATVWPLESCSDVLAQIVVWFESEWPAWYGPGGQGGAQRDLDRCLDPPGRLPRCLVALGETGMPVGTVSLRDSSPGSDRYPGAWLTALLVPQNFRCAGIGSALVAAAEQEACRLGFTQILVSTGTAQSLLRARDWQLPDALRFPGGEFEIFRKDL